MPSEKLMKIVRLELDVAGMRGNVILTDVAEDIYRKHRDTLFALDDFQLAFVNYIRGLVRDAAKEPMTDDYLQMVNIPVRYRYTLSGLPRFICVNPTKGLHRLAILATLDEWEISSTSYRALQEAVTLKGDQVDDVRRMLAAENVASIAELGTKVAA